MATVLDVWGFSGILAVEVPIDSFTRAMDRTARDRGIAPHIPSDALDLSRDIMLDEAAAALNAQWEIVGTTLRLWRSDLTVRWENIT